MTDRTTQEKVQIAKQFLAKHGYTTLPSMLNAPDVIYFLGIGRTTFYRMLKDGEFPMPYNVGSKKTISGRISMTKWKATEVQSWLESRRVTRVEEV